MHLQRSHDLTELKSSSLLQNARCSVFNSYLLAEGVATYNFMTGPSYWWTVCLPCFTDDPVPDRFRAQLRETSKLVEDLSSTFKVETSSWPKC